MLFAYAVKFRTKRKKQKLNQREQFDHYIHNVHLLSMNGRKKRAGKVM